MARTRAAQLPRAFGPWPVDGLAKLSKEEEVAVWQRAATLYRRELLAVVVVDTLVQREIKEESTSFTGEYLPLSVWEARGWDPQRIKDTATADTIKPCARFGSRYKVVVESENQAERRQRIQDTASQGAQTPKFGIANHLNREPSKNHPQTGYLRT